MINILRSIIYIVGSLCFIAINDAESSRAAHLFNGIEALAARRSVEQQISARDSSKMPTVGQPKDEEKTSQTPDTSVHIVFPKEDIEIIALFDAAHRLSKPLYENIRIEDYSDIEDFRARLCTLFCLVETTTLKDICDLKFSEYNETRKITYGDSSAPVEQVVPITSTSVDTADMEVSNKLNGCCNCMWTCTVM